MCNNFRIHSVRNEVALTSTQSAGDWRLSKYTWLHRMAVRTRTRTTVTIPIMKTKTPLEVSHHNPDLQTQAADGVTADGVTAGGHSW